MIVGRGGFRLASLGFVGAGRIVEVMTKGFIASGALRINDIWASAPTDEELRWIKQLGCNVATDNKAIVRNNRVIILAVKPHVLPVIAKQLADEVTSDHCIISVAAGVRLQTLQDLLPARTRLCRLMTNTPVMFREGVSAFSLGQHATREDQEIMHELMSSVGYCTETKEDAMDTMTGFAGGGPAYVYNVIDGLADGAVRGGIPRHEAIKMAAQIVRGAACMVQETHEHPAQLKDAVCSPGGTSIVGVHSLETDGLKGTLMNAVVAASNRAKELGTTVDK